MTDDAELLELLPSRTQELVGVVGMAAALILVEHHGGRHIWVPTKASTGHWLAGQIGMDAFAKLCGYYSYSRLEIDKCAALVRAIRDQTILQDFNDGLSNYQLATKYDTTERHIRRIKQKARQTNPPESLDLFKDLLHC